MINILYVATKNVASDRCKYLIRSIMREIRIFHATSGASALSMLTKYEIHVAFIDIELPDIDGFSLSDRIRKTTTYFSLPIVFIASTNENSVELHSRHHHYAYILKPYKDEELIVVATKLLVGIKTSNDRIINRNSAIKKKVYIPENGNLILINIYDILYAEAKMHRVFIHTKKRSYEMIPLSLSQFIERVNDECFIRCHKSYAVNIHNISSIESVSAKSWNIYFNDESNKCCFLSPTYHKELKSKLISQNLFSD